MIFDVFEKAARRYARRTAVSDAKTALTYQELLHLSARQSEMLRGRVRHGGRVRVGLVAANSVGYVSAYLAVLRAGGVPFLIDAAMGPAELATIVRECSLDLLMHDERDLGDLPANRGGWAVGLHLAEVPVEEVAYPLLDDTEVCRFTSGSTAKPNCIEFSGTAVTRAAANWAEGTGLTAADRIACFAALSNGLAFNTSLLSAFLVGASLHLGRGLPTGGYVSRFLRQSAATRLVGFPALYDSLVRGTLGPGTVGQVRIAISSGAPLRDSTQRDFHRRTGVQICSYYGVAESGPLTYTADPAAEPGNGSPLPGAVVRAGASAARPEVIRVRSESMGSRYLNAPGLFESRVDDEGFYRTGDEGYLCDGRLTLTGRTARMINVAGRKVDPVEVAEVLRRATGVLDAVAFEVTDRHGDTGVAAVVAGDARLDPDALRIHCGRHMAAYKIPGRIEVMREIPSNAIGKPAIGTLRHLVGGDR